MEYKIILSDKENKNFNGTCTMKDRNNNGEIIIYKDSKNKLKTLIHEIIHAYLFEKQKNGYKSRFIRQLNNDETFVDELAVEIDKAINKYKDEVIRRDCWFKYKGETKKRAQ